MIVILCQDYIVTGLPTRIMSLAASFYGYLAQKKKFSLFNEVEAKTKKKSDKLTYIATKTTAATVETRKSA